MAKIKIGVPYSHHSVISFITRKSLADLKKSNKYELDIKLIQGSNLPRNRNAAINSEISKEKHQKLEKFDYMLFLDSDIGFKPEDIENLVNRELPIVSAAYRKREALEYMCAGNWANHPGVVKDEKCIPWKAEGLKTVDWVGAGILLLKREVLETMEYPWFRGDTIEYEENGKVCSALTSDDIGFCLNAKRADYDIHVDCDCKVDHLAWTVSNICSDLPIDTKVEVIEEEYGKLEIDMYRTALKAEAMNQIGNYESEFHNKLNILKTTKFVLLKELEKLK